MEVWKVIGILIIIEIILLSLFSAIGQLKSEIVIVDEYRPSMNYKGDQNRIFILSSDHSSVFE